MSRTSYLTANASSAGGLSAYRHVSLDTTGRIIKNAPGRLYGWLASNDGGTLAYLKVYNKATAPTEADSPAMTLAIPAGGKISADLEPGIAFPAGISARASTGATDDDDTAPSAEDVAVNLLYA